MRVYVPYTEVDPLTEESLRGTPWTCVRMEGRGAYPLWLSSMWERGEGWVNVEHDVVVPEGSIDALTACPAHWCAHNYVGEAPFSDRGTVVFLGLAKMDSHFLSAVRPVWPHSTYRLCDFSITKAARAAGLEVHEHGPPVRNLGYERALRGPVHTQVVRQ